MFIAVLNIPNEYLNNLRLYQIKDTEMSTQLGQPTYHAWTKFIEDKLDDLLSSPEQEAQEERNTHRRAGVLLLSCLPGFFSAPA